MGRTPRTSLRPQELRHLPCPHACKLCSCLVTIGSLLKAGGQSLVDFRQHLFVLQSCCRIATGDPDMAALNILIGRLHQTAFPS